MSHAEQLSTTSALTLSWAWAFVIAMLASESGKRPSASSTSRDDRRVHADIAASQRGDGAAFARLIERYQSAIAQRMARFTRDANVVEELTHDVFVEAYFSLPDFRGNAPLEHWLQRIATRVGYRYWKRRPQADIAFDASQHDQATATDAKSNDIDSERVAVVLEQLPPRDRLVLTLLYLESHTVAEAADLAGWSQTMIKVQAYRARNKFHALYTHTSSCSAPSPSGRRSAAAERGPG